MQGQMIPTIWEYKQVKSSKEYEINQMAAEGWEIYDHHNDLKSEIVGHATYSQRGLTSSSRGSSPVIGQYTKNVVHMRRDRIFGKVFDDIGFAKRQVERLIEHMAMNRWNHPSLPPNPPGKYCQWCGAVTATYLFTSHTLHDAHQNAACKDDCPINEGGILYSSLDAMEVFQSNKTDPSIHAVYPHLRPWIEKWQEKTQPAR